MLKIKLNGEDLMLEAAMSLAQALASWGYHQAGFAVAVNSEFVARRDYATLQLKPGDQVTIVSPMQGG